MNNRRFFNISAHTLTGAQIEDVESRWGIDVIVDCPIGNVDPHKSTNEILEDAEKFVDALNVDGCDVAMVAGEPVMTMCLVKALQKKGVTCVAATTERVSVEKTLEDGSVVKQNVFNHVMFREFPPLV